MLCTFVFCNLGPRSGVTDANMGKQQIILAFGCDKASAPEHSCPNAPGTVACLQPPCDVAY